MDKEKILHEIQEAKSKNRTTLDFNNRQLSYIPHQIYELTNLEKLVLSNNDLEFLPPEIKNLQNLKNLDVQDNDLSSLPPEINLLPNLNAVNIQNNKFKLKPLLLNEQIIVQLEGNPIRPFKILVVDDESDLHILYRQMFRRELRKCEYEFVFRQSGIEALDTLGKSPDFDLICSDFNMPLMDGITLLRHTSERYPLLKTIMITAYGDMSIIRESMNNGAYDFMPKPIQYTDLKKTIENTLRHVLEIRELYRYRTIQIKNPNPSAIFRIPEELRTAFKQYFIYFKKYLKSSKNIDISFEISETKSGIRLDLKHSSENHLSKLNTYLHEYLSYASYGSEEVNIQFNNIIDEQQKKIETVALKNQILHLHNQLEIAQVKIKMLENESEKNNSYIMALIPGKNDTRIDFKPKFEFSNTINNNNSSSIRDAIADLIDSLENLKKQEEAPLTKIDYLKEDLHKEAKHLINNQLDTDKSSKIKNLTEKAKTIAKSFGKIGSFTIKNQEKIEKAANTLSNLLM